MFDLGTLVSDAARRYPRAEFVLDRPFDIAPHVGTHLTYAQLAEIIERLAAQLFAEGIRAGDVVAVYKRQNPDLLPIACALARIGAVPAMLSPTLQKPEAYALIDDLGPEHVLVGAGMLGAADVIVAEGLGSAAISSVWESAARALPRRAPPSAESTYLITHTSGTTGLPKLVAQARRTTQMPITVRCVFTEVLRFREPFALVSSFVHSRTFSAFAVAVRLGLKILLVSDPSPSSALPLLAEHQPGAVETHPNIAMAWEAALRRDDSPFARVRAVISTIDATHPRTVRTLLLAAGGRAPMLFQSYGQTETGPITTKTYTLRSMSSADGRSVGRAIPMLTRVRIVDEIGQPVPRGQSGRIAVRSRGLGLDYVGNHSRYVHNFVGGWWLMGDHGHLDRTGQLFMEDRGQDRIAGVPSVLRVEDRITEALPEIREAVLVGDDRALFLAYVPYENATVSRARLLAAADLPRGATVHLAELRWDEIPMTSTWKVRRSLLLAQLQQRGSRI